MKDLIIIIVLNTVLINSCETIHEVITEYLRDICKVYNRN